MRITLNGRDRQHPLPTAKNTAAHPAPAPPARMRSARALAWFLAFVSAFLFFGIVDLLTLPGWVDPRYEWKVPLEVSWGSLFTFVVAGSYVRIARNPFEPWPAIALLFITTGALILSSVLGLDTRPLPVAIVIGASAAVFARLTRKAATPFPRQWRVGWQHLVVAAGGIPIWLFYVLHAMGMSRAGRGDDVSWGIEHWPVQAATGLTLALSAMLMSFWVPARGLLRVTTSLSAALIGTAMLAYPERAGAMDNPMWGVSMVVWATVLALLEPVAKRRDPANPTHATELRHGTRSWKSS